MIKELLLTGMSCFFWWQTNLSCKKLWQNTINIGSLFCIINTQQKLWKVGAYTIQLRLVSTRIYANCKKKSQMKSSPKIYGAQDRKTMQDWVLPYCHSGQYVLFGFPTCRASKHVRKLSLNKSAHMSLVFHCSTDIPWLMSYQNLLLTMFENIRDRSETWLKKQEKEMVDHKQTIWEWSHIVPYVANHENCGNNWWVLACVATSTELVSNK
jgi:hypothetical protein